MPPSRLPVPVTEYTWRNATRVDPKRRPKHMRLQAMATVQFRNVWRIYARLGDYYAESSNRQRKGVRYVYVFPKSLATTARNLLAKKDYVDSKDISRILLKAKLDQMIRLPD